MWSYLWQNFLIDSKIRSYIAEHIAKMYKELGCEALIEIGPGKGAITKLIEHISDNFFVIEKDLTLVEGWKLKVEGWTIIQWDVLETDVDTLLKSKKLDMKKTLVVWNLPYYITSPILRKFFWNGSQNYAWGIFMLQDEVGQKLRSDAKKKSYLWRLINYAYQVNYLKWVPGKCFKPIPKVKSCLVELKCWNVEMLKGWEQLIQFLEMFAPFSRKTLGAIRTMVNKKSGCVFVIPEELKKKRLEELSFEELSTILT
jgi:16S rRNA (adenine1518-N6/adenine1519-N6)-dimethyltransferase